MINNDESRSIQALHLSSPEISLSMPGVNWNAATTKIESSKHKLRLDINIIFKKWKLYNFVTEKINFSLIFLCKGVVDAVFRSIAASISQNLIQCSAWHQFVQKCAQHLRAIPLRNIRKFSFHTFVFVIFLAVLGATHATHATKKQTLRNCNCNWNTNKRIR